MEDREKEIREAEETRAGIRARFPDVVFPRPVLEPIFYGRLTKNPVFDRKLVRDTVSGNQFDIVSDAYKLIHHEDVVKRLIEACPEEFGEPSIKIDLFKGGARCKIEATFPELSDMKVNNSPIEPKVNVGNSLDRSSHLTYSYGANEQVCTNGLVAYREKGRGRSKHLSASLNKFQLQGRIREDLGALSEQIGIWESWAKKQLSELQIKEVVESLPFSEKEQEGLLSLPLLNHNNETIISLDNKVSLWTVNSAATQMVHNIASDTRRASLDEDIASVITRYSRKLAA